MKRLFVLILSLSLVAAACGGGDDTGDTPSDTDPTTAPTTTVATPTTTEGPTTTEPSAGGDAAFVISEVVFGSDGYVAVTNIGTGAGSLDRHQLCQRPSYFGIDDVTVAAGETVYFTVNPDTNLDGQQFQAGSGFGRLQASSGEIALYSSGSFSSSDDILSYVEWGSRGHGRTTVAVGAGIWSDGDFVVTDESSTGLTANTSEAPTSSASWTVS